MLAIPKNDFDGILKWLLSCRHDPVRWITTAYPWGRKGTELERFTGPRQWQLDQAHRIKASLQGNPYALVQEATSSGHGIGKAHPKSMMLHTPVGYVRWGDIKVGDFVFGASGKPVTVTAVHDRGQLQTYKVSFDDGSDTMACADHLWSVRGRQERRTNAGWVTLSTAQIIERGVKRKNGVSMARQFEIPNQGAAEFVPSELAIHPYTLGVWLGDGGRNSGRITSNDQEVIDRLTDVGETVTKNHGMAWGVAGLHRKLISLGIADRYSYQKSVPVQYMESDSATRLELLRGLLDTDGECNKDGSIGFSSTSYALAKDVVWLVRSIGGKARFQPTTKMPSYTGKNGEKLAGLPCHRVTATFPDGISAFYIARKQERVKAVQDRYLSRWIASIEMADVEDCMCITVDAPDSLYLANDFIVTHNSADMAMIGQWALMTYPDTKGVITANTDNQLRTKTWPEMGKWYGYLPPEIKEMFVYESTSLHIRGATEKEKLWRLDAIPWSEHNTEAFAGLHNEGKRIFLGMDEASAIADKVWEVAEGALTDDKTEMFWLAKGNPTRTTGRFKECWGRFKHRWHTQSIDSRTVEGTNKAQLQKWVDDYGDDSDFVRVRVKGMFPRASSAQFIESDIVMKAMESQPYVGLRDPLIMGIDVARGGNDSFVIAYRRGMDAKSIPMVVIPGSEARNSEKMIAKITDLATTDDKLKKPDAIFVDETGLGGPIVDRLRGLLGDQFQVLGVQFGGVSPNTKLANMRTYIWWKMREALGTGLVIPHDATLEMELTAPEYYHDNKDRLMLESKEDTKDRVPGIGSPDRADGLAITFAYNVQPRQQTAFLNNQQRAVTDYDPWNRE